VTSRLTVECSNRLS